MVGVLEARRTPMYRRGSHSAGKLFSGIRWDFKSVVFFVLVCALLAFSAANTLNMVLYPTVMAEKLTDIFDTLAFKGSFEVINKWNWVGWLFNTIISVFSLFGLVMVLYQRLVTLVYLSSRNTWDTVDDIKTGGDSMDRGGGGRFDFGGWSGIFRRVGEGRGGTGTDVIIGFLLSLLPNIKRQSDYNPDRIGNIKGLKVDDGVGTYMLKTAAPTILIIFFFAIGFSGTLARGYGMIVDGMAAAADTAVNANLRQYVEDALKDSYKFSYGNDGTGEGDFKMNVCQAVYGKVLSKMGTQSEVSRLNTGASVEAWVGETITAEALLAANCVTENYYLDSASLAGDTADSPEAIRKIIDANWRALQFEVIMNNQESAVGALASNPVGGDDGFATGMGQATEGDGINFYIHVFVRQGQASEEMLRYFDTSGAGTGS